MANRLELTGKPAAPGLAAGPLVRLGSVDTLSRRAGTEAEELAALEAAITASAAEVTALAAAQKGGDAADILEFQVAMLADDELRAPALAAIAGGTAADKAWCTALDKQIEDYQAAEDDYFRARAADLCDLRDRVLRHLAKEEAESGPPPGAVLLGAEMTPTRFLETDWTKGGGIALEEGSPASHVAMLARARGVPMVVGLGPVADGGHAEAIVDGTDGRLVFSPDDADRLRSRAMSARAAEDMVAAGELLYRPAYTCRGERVQVMLNIADPAELDELDPALCDGIGLVRTELLFQSAGGLPDEERQYAVYHRILNWAAGRPVTIRTLDAGGDKPIPGLTIAAESNPFLGVRGIRLSLSRPEVFRVQLRALARAAVHGVLKVMLPMVTVPEELEVARALLREVLADLSARGLSAMEPALGMMVEVPAAALAIDRFDAAFFSLGSNDLTQYVTASARDIGAVAPLADVRNPAVLRLMTEVAVYGRETGREVSICGDAAGDPEMVPALLGAGLTCLSMAPNAVGRVKLAIARV
jgi:phosphotransferase system enzyme I (PtsI)